MSTKLFITAGLTLGLALPAAAQLPGIDAPTGAGVGIDHSRSSTSTTGKRAEPATPSEIAPRDRQEDRGQARAGRAENPQGRDHPPVMGSTENKLEGSAPIDSGIGRSGDASGGGAMKGGTNSGNGVP